MSANMLFAALIVGACLSVGYVAGIVRTCARLIPAMLHQGWSPPASAKVTRSDNPFRGGKP